MQLTLWTYEAPPHVGAMRIATAGRMLSIADLPSLPAEVSALILGGISLVNDPAAGIDYNNGANWRSSAQVGGTPGVVDLAVLRGVLDEGLALGPDHRPVDRLEVVG